MYFVNIVQFIGFGFLPIAYYIIFAGLLSSFLRMLPFVQENSFWTFLGTQWFSVLVLAVLIFPLIIKKQINELKIAGMLLFSGVILFIVLMFVLRILSGDILPYNREEEPLFYRFHFNQAFLSSLSTALVAYGFQSAFFPIYNSLKNKNYYRGMKFTFLGITFCFIIYMLIMFISIYSFGIHIRGDVLQNVEEVEEWESFVLRAIFLLVMSTHTPFIFFIGKESLLAIFGLLYRRHQKRQRRRRRAKRKARRKARQEAKSRALNDNHGLISSGLNDSLVDPRNNNYKIVSAPHLAQSFESTVSMNSGSSSDSEESDSEAENSYQSDTEIVIMNTVDANMVKAIGFSTKVIEVDKDEGESDSDENMDKKDTRKGAEDILPSWMYYSVTLGLYALVVAASCFIREVEPVIKFVGSIANSTLNFTLPGIFYFLIMKRSKAVIVPWWKLTLALLLAIYGVVMGVV